MEWKQLTRNRKLYNSQDGYSIIVPDDDMEIIPLDCDVCGYLMQNYSDVISYRESRCCSHCFMKWAEVDLESWNSGARPPENEIEEEKKKRANLPSIIVR